MSLAPLGLGAVRPPDPAATRSQRPGGDAARRPRRRHQQGLAFSLDVTPRYCAADPFEGGKQAVAECWRNLTAVGAEPLAVTDNLNFGNPERPEIMGQLVGAIEASARPAARSTSRSSPAMSRSTTRPTAGRSRRRRRSAASASSPTSTASATHRLQGGRRGDPPRRRAAGLGHASRPVDLSPRDPRPRGRAAAAGRPRPREARRRFRARPHPRPAGDGGPRPLRRRPRRRARRDGDGLGDRRHASTR